MKELAAALAKAQSQVRHAIKDSKNPGFRSSYADLTSVWDACREALTKNGLSVVQKTDFDAGEIWLETMLIHASGEHISSRYPLRPVKADPQGYGSAMTYARRYCLAAIVGVVADEDDDGNAASNRSTAAVKPVAPAKPAEPEAPRENPADAAREWANQAITEIGQIKTQRDYDDWLAKNAPRVAKLKLYPDEHKYVTSALKTAQDSVRAAA